MDGVTRVATPPRTAATHEPDSVRRARVITHPSVLLVGASTGGPQALTALVAKLVPVVVRLPICVTLHMPAELMSVIAAHVARTCGLETCVVQTTQELVPGTVYFAPGDRHLGFRRRESASIDLHLTTGAPSESCKPAVDVMFASAATCFKSRALAVVLSGMGEDGLAGARAIVAAGGRVFAQDKPSSAVWGMPGAIVKAGLATAVLSPPAIAEEIVRSMNFGARSA